MGGLELGALGLAEREGGGEARCAGLHDPAEVEAVHEAVSAATGPARHRQADSRFHLTIAAVTGSPRVIEAVTAVQSTLHEMLSAIPVLDANIAHSDIQHARIVQAILAGRAERARQVMEEHCDDTAALLRGLLG